MNIAKESVPNRYQFLNGLALKIIAVLLMTLDHIAMFFMSGTAEIVCRSIGRLAFPLFTFLAMEGIYHSKDPLRYGLVLLGLGLAMDLVVYFIDRDLLGNVFTDLGLGILMCTLLRRKDRWSLLAVLPLSFAFLSVYMRQYFHSDYGVYGQLVFLAFFAGYELSPLALDRIAKRGGIDSEAVVQRYQRTAINALASVFFLTVALAFYLLFRYDYSNPLLPFSYNIESYSIFAIPLILLYSGKRGYTNPVLKYSFYVYYPLHSAVLYLLFTLLHG